MKKAFVSLFVLIAFASSVFGESLAVPGESGTADKNLAVELLDLCTMHSQKLTAAAFEEKGFSVRLQSGYDRPASTVDHTSAYTIGQGKILLEGKEVPAYLVVIRGTDGTEWLSNFDFSFSGSDETLFADNFLSSAEDVFISLSRIIKDPDAVVLVSGHSRGAAVANLLGLLLNQIHDPAKNYIYTFATPATVRNLSGLTDWNIFNFINPCDVVPCTPPERFGFVRCGKDFMLDQETLAMSSQKISDVFKKLTDECPDIQSYYEKKINLTKLGFDFGIDLGNMELTFYQLMMALGTELSKLTFTDSSLEEQGIVMKGMDSLGEAAGDSPLSFILREHMPARYRTKILRMDLGQ